MQMLKWTITSKTIVFVITISIKTYGLQKLMNILPVCESEPLNSSDRYAVAVLNEDIIVGSCHRKWYN